MSRTTTLENLGSPMWSSALVEYIQRRGPARATVEKWLEFIRGAAEHGISKDELQYSRLQEMLAQLHGGSNVLERKEVLSGVLLRAAMPSLQIVVDTWFRPSDDWIECAQAVNPREYVRRKLMGRWPTSRYVLRYRHRSLGWSVALVRHADLFHAERKWWLILEPRGGCAPGQPAYGFRSAAEAMTRAVEMMRRQRWYKSARPRRRLLWEKFSLQGLDEYAELLIALPNLEAASYYSEAHFPGVRNLLVHLRANICQSEGGRRVLFLDEVQSDWHRSLAEQDRESAARGKRQVPHAPFGRDWPLLALKFALWWARRIDLDGVAWSSPEHHEWRWLPFRNPPTTVYRHALPEAAAKLAKTLSLELSHTAVSRRRVDAVGKAPVRWEVYSRAGVSTTRAFTTRLQAQRFADLTGAVDWFEVPVLWLRSDLNVDRMPLFGVGGVWLWGDQHGRSGSPGRRAVATREPSVTRSPMSESIRPE